MGPRAGSSSFAPSRLTRPGLYPQADEPTRGAVPIFDLRHVAPTAPSPQQEPWPSSPGHALMRKCAQCDDDEAKKKIMAKPAGGAGLTGSAAPGLDTAAALRAVERPGDPLPAAERAFFEPRFGHDLGRVRVHTDGAAAEAARGVRARAYTTGTHIVFGHGEYAPGTTDGRRLLAHELTHVMQQSGGAPLGPERERAPSAPERPGGALVQRQADAGADYIDTELDEIIAAARSKMAAEGPAGGGAGGVDAGKDPQAAKDPPAAGQDPQAAKDPVAAKDPPAAGQDPQAVLDALVRLRSSGTPEQKKRVVEQLHQAGMGKPLPPAPSVQKKAAHVSAPGDPLEQEADRVAAQVMDQGRVAQTPSRIGSAPVQLVQRQGWEEALGAGAISAGPIGWALLATVVVGVGIYVATRPRTTTLAPPTTAPTATTVPTTAPTTAAPTRRHPNQTCEDARLDVLQAIKDRICGAIVGESCSPSKVSPKRLARRPCSEIVARLAALAACLAARRDIQSECFGNVPDPTHAQAIQEILNAIASCETLRATNCAPGHPMAGL